MRSRAHERWQFGAHLLPVGTRQVEADEVAGYNRLDLALTHRQSAPLSLSVSVQNATDAELRYITLTYDDLGFAFNFRLAKSTTILPIASRRPVRTRVGGPPNSAPRLSLILGQCAKRQAPSAKRQAPSLSALTN